MRQDNRVQGKTRSEGRSHVKAHHQRIKVVVELLRGDSGSWGTGRTGRALGTRSRPAKVLRTVSSGTVVRHAHVVRRRRGRAVRRANSRVVLRATPAQADARVANGVTLHLVDGHLCGVAVDELNEAAALARGDLDVRDLAEALEERSQLILGDITRESTDEDSSIVRIGELVHLSSWVEAAVATAVREAAHLAPHLLLRHTAHHGAAVVVTVSETMVTTVLGGSGGNTHGAVAAVDTLHLDKSTLLVILVGKANEPVATALTGHGIGHDLSRLAGREACLEERNQNVFIDLGTEIADEDAVLRTTVVASVNQTTARRPVKLELAGAVGNRVAIKTQGLGGCIGGGELDEAVASVSRVLVADDLDINSLASSREEDALNEVLIHPRFELSHPKGSLGRLLTGPRRRGN